MAKILWATALAGVMIAHGQTAVAQETGSRPVMEAGDEDYYYPPRATQPPDARTIIRQKAMARAEQRNIRLMKLASFGIQSGRPAIATTPFTASYGPTWQSNPWPFVWLEARRPNYFIVR